MRGLTYKLLLSAAVLGLAVCSYADTIRVPQDQPTIQEGIDAASAGDTVLVACGTYNECSIDMKSGVYLTSETGQAECVTIDGCWTGIICSGVDSTAWIRGFTITDCQHIGILCSMSSPIITDCELSSNGEHGEYGGGMRCAAGSSPTLMGVTFSDNSAFYGAGMYCEDSAPTLTDCDFSGNSASSRGGGMLCDGSAPTLTQCTFSGNEAGYYGGGLRCFGGSHAALVDCSFSGNLVGSGGGGVCCSGSSPVTLERCAFSDNSARWGGGVDCRESSPPMLTNCTLSANTAEMGGALYCRGSCPATLAGCIVSGNSASWGGGMFCRESSPPELTACTFCGNSADMSAGGVYCWGSAPVTVGNCTFADNYAAGSGGGVYLEHDSSADVENTIVAFSTGGEAVYCDGGSNATFICSDVYGNEGGDWVGCLLGQNGQDGNISVDPLFCRDENPEEPYTLHTSSPCAEENSPCGLIGAWDLGCPPVAVKQTSWGSIKAIFR